MQALTTSDTFNDLAVLSRGSFSFISSLLSPPPHRPSILFILLFTLFRWCLFRGFILSQGIPLRDMRYVWRGAILLSKKQSSINIQGVTAATRVSPSRGTRLSSEELRTSLFQFQLLALGSGLSGLRSSSSNPYQRGAHENRDNQSMTYGW